MLTAVTATPRVPHGTILVVDDELRSLRQLRMNLEPLGYHVITLDHAESVTDAVEIRKPDLVVLEIKQPGAEGLAICQQIRARSAVPIIIVSAFGQPADIARSLYLGADDYVVKPYDAVELVARIEAVLRRAKGQASAQISPFRCGPLAIDYEQRLVTLNGKEIQLSRTEYRLLEHLAQNAGRTLVADALLSKVWGPEYSGDYASLHLYISRLRRKLGEDAHGSRLIVTKPGIGYMMPKDVETPIALMERAR